MGLKTGTYLDNLTLAPIYEEAGSAVSRALQMGLGHPRSCNYPGREAQRFLGDMKERTASFFGGGSVIFFCDGEMANAISILSAGRLARDAGRGHIAASPVESSSVVSALRALQREGSTVSLLEADSNGRIVTGSISRVISEKTGLVTCSWANEVSGIIQPVEEIADVSRSAGAWFHCDACSAAGRLSIDMSATSIDALTVCSMKIGGPPGSAAVVLADNEPWIMSASPEFSCIVNLPGVYGMVTAMDLASGGIEARKRIVNSLREDLLKGLDSFNVDYSIIGEKLDNILPGTALLEIGNPIEKLHARLEKERIILPSHNSSERLSFLRRIGRDISNPENYLGFSIDSRNTSADIEHFVRSFAKVYSQDEGN